MRLFQRALRWLFFLFGLIIGLAAAIAVFFAQRLNKPLRQRLWATPKDIGLSFENVRFTARDGIKLSGWFVPADTDSQRQGGTILLVHGWSWNRLGGSAEDALSSLTRATPVDFLRLVHSLHQDGYHTLMFDLRNHGQSASAPPMTFGWQESADLLGALDYVSGRPDVNKHRLGVVGFSAGANTLLYALPQTDQIKAAIAVQPMTVSLFARRFATDLLGPLSKLTLPLVELIYRAYGGPPFSAIKPGFAAAGTGETPLLFIQSEGDPWGAVDDVARMAEASPNAEDLLLVDAYDRFSGYQFPVNNPKMVAAFFEQHLSV